MDIPKDTLAHNIGWTAAQGALLAALKQRAALRLILLALNASSAFNNQSSVYRSPSHGRRGKVSWESGGGAASCVGPV